MMPDVIYVKKCYTFYGGSEPVLTCKETLTDWAWLVDEPTEICTYQKVKTATYKRCVEEVK